MKEAAAYVLCVLGGKAAPSAADVKVRPTAARARARANAPACACRQLRERSAARISVQAVIESVEGAEADDEQITKLLAGLEGKVSGGGI